MRLVYVNLALVEADREQREYEHGMDLERAKYLAEGRCYDCDKIVLEAGGTLAGMLICVDCAEKELAQIEAMEAT